MTNCLNDDRASSRFRQTSRNQCSDGFHMHRRRDLSVEVPVSEVRTIFIEADEPLPFVSRVQLFRKRRWSVSRLWIRDVIVFPFFVIASKDSALPRNNGQCLKHRRRSSNIYYSYTNHVLFEISSVYNRYVRSDSHSEPWARSELLPDLDCTDDGCDRSCIGSCYISDCHLSNFPALFSNYCSLNNLQLTSCCFLRGVLPVLQVLQGTGGGSAAQDSMNIDFSNEQVPQCL